MNEVILRIYDLSSGMARTMSPALLGKQIDGIWHTGLVVYGREYYFGGGICADPPGQTPYGTPHTIEPMGTTQKTREDFRQFLASIAARFTFATYHLLDNNCNNFSDACCRFLLGKSIPQYILDLPAEAMNSPLGPMIRPVIEQMQMAIQQQSIGHEIQLPDSPSAPFAPVSNNSAGESVSTDTIATKSCSQSYWSTPITLEKGDRNLIISKLSQFAPQFSLNESDLIQLGLSLPPHHAFPALDLLRLHVADRQSVALKFAAQYPSLASRFIINEEAPPSACMMTLRGAVNCFKHADAAKVLSTADVAEAVVESIATSLTKEKSQIRKTGALLALNFAGAHRRNIDVPKLSEDHSVRLLFCAVERLNANDTSPLPDEVRPLLSALIALVDGDADALVMAKTFGLDLGAFQNEKSCPDESIRAAASKLADLMSSG